MMPAVILHEAEVELWDAIAYYEDKSPGLGLDFALELERSVTQEDVFRSDGLFRKIAWHFFRLMAGL